MYLKGLRIKDWILNLYNMFLIIREYICIYMYNNVLDKYISVGVVFFYFV